MKTYTPIALALTVALSPLGCGDDGDSSTELDPGSTGAGSTTATPASSSTDAPDPQSTGEDVTTGGTSEDGTSSGSSSADDESGSTGEDPFADCQRDVLEEDIVVIDPMGMPGPPQWYGPGADDDGALIDDGESEYVVSSTYLALQPNADPQLFGQLSAGNAMALFTNPGMIAVQLSNSTQCGTARTFTVWENEEALMNFVGSDAHLQSVSAFPSLSRGGSTLSVWAEPVTASEITWDAAMTRMADETPYD